MSKNGCTHDVPVPDCIVCLTAEIERLNMDINKRCEWAAEMISERDAMRRKLDDLRETLAWYAEKGEALHRYGTSSPPNDHAMEAVTVEIMQDHGKRARAILDAEEERDEEG